MNYLEFLERKQKQIANIGFEIYEDEINPMLFTFQKYIVKLAIQKGRFAIFGGTGTGKTFIQCEIANILSKQGFKSIIVAPLAVSMQTINEAAKLDITINKYDLKSNIQIINYNNVEKIDFSKFDCVILDESSILKNYEGAIKQTIIENTKNMRFKFAFTATPSPNDITELANHCEYLQIMSRNEMLSKYFVHDSGQTSVWRLKRHGVELFYKFVSQWSIMFENPEDLGFNDVSFKLPKLNIEEIKINTDNKTGMLFNNISINAIDFNKTLRNSIEIRMKKVIEIVNNSKENFIIWVKLNDESEYLHKMIPDSKEVIGSESTESKEEKLIGFGKNEFRVLITKPKIAQFGLNYQNCHNQIFASLDFSFESFFQSVRRSYRYGQKEQVNITIITLDTMQNVLNIIKDKQKNYNKMLNQILKNYRINQNGKSN